MTKVTNSSPIMVIRIETTAPVSPAPRRPSGARNLRRPVAVAEVASATYLVTVQ